MVIATFPILFFEITMEVTLLAGLVSLQYLSKARNKLKEIKKEKI